MGWLWLVRFLKLQVSFAEFYLYFRALLQMKHVILWSVLIVATPYHLLGSLLLQPDLAKFGMSCLDADVVGLFKKRVYDMAGVTPGMYVYMSAYIHLLCLRSDLVFLLKKRISSNGVVTPCMCVCVRVNIPTFIITYICSCLRVWERVTDIYCTYKYGTREHT